MRHRADNARRPDRRAGRALGNCGAADVRAAREARARRSAPHRSHAARAATGDAIEAASAASNASSSPGEISRWPISSPGGASASRSRCSDGSSARSKRQFRNHLVVFVEPDLDESEARIKRLRGRVVRHVADRRSSSRRRSPGFRRSPARAPRGRTPPLMTAVDHEAVDQGFARIVVRIACVVHQEADKSFAGIDRARPRIGIGRASRKRLGVARRAVLPDRDRVRGRQPPASCRPSRPSVRRPRAFGRADGRSESRNLLRGDRHDTRRSR